MGPGVCGWHFLSRSEEVCFCKCRKSSVGLAGLGAPSRVLGSPVFNNAVNTRLGRVRSALPLGSWAARFSEMPQITSPAAHNCCSFSRPGPPGLRRPANYSSCPSELPFPHANSAALLARAPEKYADCERPWAPFATICKARVPSTWDGGDVSSEDGDSARGGQQRLPRRGCVGEDNGAAARGQSTAGRAKSTKLKGLVIHLLTSFV